MQSDGAVATKTAPNPMAGNHALHEIAAIFFMNKHGTYGMNRESSSRLVILSSVRAQPFIVFPNSQMTEITKNVINIEALR